MTLTTSALARTDSGKQAGPQKKFMKWTNEFAGFVLLLCGTVHSCPGPVVTARMESIRKQKKCTQLYDDMEPVILDLCDDKNKNNERSWRTVHAITEVISRVEQQCDELLDRS